MVPEKQSHGETIRHFSVTHSNILMDEAASVVAAPGPSGTIHMFAQLSNKMMTISPIWSEDTWPT